MPKPGLRITCEHCGFSWSDGDHGMQMFHFTNIRRVQLSDNSVSCPRCGRMASLPEGTFDVREGRWRLIRDLANDLRSAEATSDDYAKLLDLLRQAKETGQEANQVANEIAAQTPFARLAETFRAHPPGWTAWLIAAILTIVMWRFPYHSDETPQHMSKPSQNAPVVLQLTNRELDDLARQIDAQLEQQKDLARPVEIAVSGPKGSQRNKPCPCGSGVKYKKCCGKVIQEQQP